MKIRNQRFIETSSTKDASDDDDNNSNDDGWKAVSNGLPEPRGIIISILAANPKVSGEFYAVNNRGIFSSTNSGISWKMLNEGIEWPKEYLTQHPFALAVIDINSSLGAAKIAKIMSNAYSD